MSTFEYKLNVINNLECGISAARLSTYLKVTNDNKEDALKMYLWNSEISAAFYLPLQGLEITLRNALHQNISKIYKTQDWFDLAPLDEFGKQAIEKAKKAISKNRCAVDAPHIVAELSFGFWLSLLNREYHQSLWEKGLGKSFPNAGLRRSEIHKTLDHVRVLRNRIAHHESIFRRHLEEDYNTIIKVICWMNEEKAKWIDHHNSVKLLLSKKPQK